MSRIKNFASRDAQAAALAVQVGDELRTILDEKGKAVLAVAGGSTPGPFFDALSAEELDWANVTVMPSDERFVDETSDRSNARLIKARLLKNRASIAGFATLYAQAETPEAALPVIQAAVSEHMPLDICVLGMGADMHTASLFPGGDNLDAALADDAPDALTMRPMGDLEARITLSAKAINTAQYVHVLICGVDKSDALSVAMKAGPVTDAPIRSILSHSNVDVYYAD